MTTNQARKREKSCSREKSIKNRFLASLLGPRVDFWSILETRLGPAGSPNTLRDVPGTLQILCKSSACIKNRADLLLGGSREAPKRLPEGSRKVPGHPQGPTRDNVSSILNSFLKSCYQQMGYRDTYSFIKFVNGLAKQISRQLRTFVRL